MSDVAADFWTDETSVLFTSFYGWTPDTWGTVGWTGDRGLGRRNNLLKQLSDPFITVCSITSNTTYGDPGLKGMIGGFYLVTHETGDRTEFTHPTTHSLWPGKWRHSLRAIRAFSYLPEYRLKVTEFDPTIHDRALHVAAMGEVITDFQQIKKLRETPWVEVEIFSPKFDLTEPDDEFLNTGLVKAGPASRDGYVVSQGTQQLRRELYVLRLLGDTDAYLGRDADGKAIFKLGLSVSPELRRQAFERSMPRGTFRWIIDRTSSSTGFKGNLSFEAAVAGEYAMKEHLADCADWLGGEFYLASSDQIGEAWKLGHAAAKSELRQSKQTPT